jgi:hypothetical protein
MEHAKVINLLRKLPIAERFKVMSEVFKEIGDELRLMEEVAEWDELSDEAFLKFERGLKKSGKKAKTKAR